MKAEALFLKPSTTRGGVSVLVRRGARQTMSYNATINTSREDVYIFCKYLYIGMSPKKSEVCEKFSWSRVKKYRRCTKAYGQNSHQPVTVFYAYN